ncbi:hypothetical protein EON66_08615 [archaeon]|nr:MAG: hypothetical protein EON66_08615 [archaeon]
MMSSTATDGSSDLSADLDGGMSAGDVRHGASLEELADSNGERLDRPALGEAGAGSLLNQYMVDEHMDMESTQLVTGEIRRLEECGARPLTELMEPITLSNALAYIASVELACICSPDVAINFLRSDVRATAARWHSEFPRTPRSSSTRLCVRVYVCSQWVTVLMWGSCWNSLTLRSAPGARTCSQSLAASSYSCVRFLPSTHMQAALPTSPAIFCCIPRECVRFSCLRLQSA